MLQQQQPLYQVVGWDDHFENDRSRTRDKCAFVCIPNRHGGLGLATVLGMPDGLAIYGAWALLLQVLSRQPKGRAGWLTENGKKDGRRLSGVQLSHAFRAPVSQVYRMLQACSSEDVGWMKLVEGTHEWEESNGAQTPSADEKRGAERESTVSDSPRNGSHPLPATVAQVPLITILPQVSESPRTGSESPPTPPERKKEGIERRKEALASEGEQTEPENLIIQHAEAKLTLGRLAHDVFGEKIPANGWSVRYEQHLDENLPLTQPQLDVIEWAYRQGEQSELRTKFPKHHRRSFAALLENLRSEAQKFTAIKKELAGGAGGDYAPRKETPAPDGWKDAALHLWGEARKIPRAFGEYSASDQRAIRDYAAQAA